MGLAATATVSVAGGLTEMTGRAPTVTSEEPAERPATDPELFP